MQVEFTTTFFGSEIGSVQKRVPYGSSARIAELKDLS